MRRAGWSNRELSGHRQVRTLGARVELTLDNGALWLGAALLSALASQGSVV